MTKSLRQGTSAPVCTYLGCVVHWNRWEESWYCPRHGSRFRPDGSILEDPALKPLERKELRSAQG